MLIDHFDCAIINRCSILPAQDVQTQGMASCRAHCLPSLKIMLLCPADSSDCLGMSQDRAALSQRACIQLANAALQQFSALEKISQQRAEAVRDLAQVSARNYAVYVCLRLSACTAWLAFGSSAPMLSAIVAHCILPYL